MKNQTMKEINLEENERLDDMQINDIFLVQNKNLYTFTSDSVLLANFVKAKYSDKVLELCAGNGVISILVNEKNNIEKIVSIEMQKEMVKLFQKNLLINDISNIEIINTKVQDYCENNSIEYDVIFCNPPYKDPYIHKNVEKSSINICKYEFELKCKDLVLCCNRLLKYGGTLYLIYDSSRINELFNEMIKNNIEPKEIQFVYPKIDKDSNVCLIKAIKNGKKGIKVMPPKILE